jgi:hypothetical protein
MPPTPTLFDDDGEPRSDRDRGSVDELDPTPPEGPNYLVRRAIVVGAVVAVIAVGAVVIGMTIGGSGADTSSGAASIEWNRVVLVDQRTGAITITDDAGEAVATIDTDLRTPTAADVVGPTALLATESGAVVVDLESEQVQDVAIDATTIVSPTGSTFTMIAPVPTGRRGLLVHGPSCYSIDTDEFAPVAGADYEFAESRTDTSGRHVLVTDSGNFQSVLFSFDRDEPSFFPGLALAVDADTVVTAQNVGNEATVSIFDHTGEPLASGRTASVRAAMITGDSVRLVTVDGEIVTMDAGSGDTTSGDQLEIGTIEFGHVMTTGDRLVVTGSAGAAVVDDQGDVLAVSTDAVPYPDPAARRGSTCIALSRVDTSGPDQLVMVDARDGSTVIEAEAASDTISWSADGCTVAISLEDGYDIVDADGVVSVGDDALLTLSPDGVLAVVERDRRLLLTAIGADTDTGTGTSTDPIDLGPRGPSTFFTQT